MSSPVSIYFGDSLGAYGFGDGHPFGPDRIQAFWKETTRRGLQKKVNICAPQSCTETDLALFHTAPYIQKAKALSSAGSGFLDCGDTPAVKGIYESACTVVGSGLDGLDRIMRGASPRVFVPIAGLHHARPDSAAGFCVFNDIGVLINALRQRHGIRRIAYVDIDAHHGDGVFYTFEDDPDLIFADIHEDGRYLYPGTGDAAETGKGAAAGSKLNIPAPPDSTDAFFHKVWPEVTSFVDQARPEIIIFQAGADSIDGDPITHMRFTPAAHRHAAASLCNLADKHCDGRIIALGGGGYNRTNLALGWNDVVEAMASG